VVSIANRGHPHTGGSQFFIVVSDSPHLDGKYSAFGRVTAGMEIADQIASTPRDEYGRYGPPDRPLEDVVVESVRIEPVKVAPDPAAGASAEAAAEPGGSATAPSAPAQPKG
jgi:peptidyl-prolyl cis-trans isomerase B (cyclophilin B)